MRVYEVVRVLLDLLGQDVAMPCLDPWLILKEAGVQVGRADQQAPEKPDSTGMVPGRVLSSRQGRGHRASLSGWSARIRAPAR
jgi:hypothetical protein